MRARIIYMVLVAALAAPAIARAESPPLPSGIAAWAAHAGYRIRKGHACDGLDERPIGARNSRCWDARRRTPLAHSRDYPRVDIIVAVYDDEDAARAQMARFLHPPAYIPEEAKSYPLRAGFRLGDRLVTITTDAFEFKDHAYRVAMALAAKLGGTDLICWQDCPKP